MNSSKPLFATDRTARAQTAVDLIFAVALFVLAISAVFVTAAGLFSTGITDADRTSEADQALSALTASELTADQQTATATSLDHDSVVAYFSTSDPPSDDLALGEDTAFNVTISTEEDTSPAAFEEVGGTGTTKLSRGETPPSSAVKTSTTATLDSHTVVIQIHAWPDV